MTSMLRTERKAPEGAGSFLGAVTGRDPLLLRIRRGRLFDQRAHDRLVGLDPVGDDVPLLPVPLLELDGAAALVISVLQLLLATTVLPRAVVMGSSLGGVVSLFLAWQWPGVFGNAGCLSSTFGFRDDLLERIESEPKRPIKIYLDSGWPHDNYETTRIMRNTLRGARIERRRFEFVMMATVLAGFWSLMSGTFFLMTLRAAGLLA